MSIRHAALTLAAATTLFGGAMTASAQEVNIRVLGWFANQPQIDDVEIPFWKQLGEKTGGKMTATFRTINEVGLKGFESLRTLRSGAFDIISFQVGYVSGDDPLFIGHDIPGLATNFEEVRKVAEAYRPVLERQLQERYGGKLLAQWPFPPQILFCKEPIKGLADLKGRKVRVTGAVPSDMVTSWGATAVTVSGPEVYQAIQRGLVDCAATGSQYGNEYGWYEVSNQLFMLPLGGYALVLHVARLDFWNKLSPDQQQFLATEMKRLEDGMWAITDATHRDGVNCNTGRQPCASGKLGSMTVLEPSAEDRRLFRETLEKVALPSWAKDCERVDPECRAKWNETVGKAVDMKL